MSCKCAVKVDEYSGWKCTITDGPCEYWIPNSKRCAEEFGEGPDAEEILDAQGDRKNEEEV